MKTHHNPYSMKLRGRLISLRHPLVMGIVNVTPDSFYSSSRTGGEKEVLLVVEKMLKEGVAIVDMGGQSTRPGATLLSAAEERNRLESVLKSVVKEFPDLNISIDTFYSEVARFAVGEGACMINDISGGRHDKQMFDTVASLDVPYVLMHAPDGPSGMHRTMSCENICADVALFFSEKLEALRQAGVHDVVLDPGFGFGKNLEQNFELLNGLNHFQMFGLPLLAGLSRKRMIQQTAGTDADGALNGTTAANMVALMAGAKLLRVHDVKEAVQAINIYNALQRS